MSKLPRAVSPAISVAVQTATDDSGCAAGCTIARHLDSDLPDIETSWFKVAARDLLGSDPGLSLHVLTGISIASGYRYANGHRPPTAYVIRQLLRGPQGSQWLAAIMQGCRTPWWLEQQRKLHNAEQLAKLDLR